jgi:hypothetical protein
VPIIEAAAPHGVEISVLGRQVMSRQPVRIVEILEDLLRQSGESCTAPPGEASTSLAPGVPRGSSPSGILTDVPRYAASLVALV